MAELLYGAPAAKALKEQMKAKIAELSERGIVPCIAVLRAGNDESQLSYERGLGKTFGALGMRLESIQLPEDVSREALCAAIDEINRDEQIHGCLILRPLPGGLETQALLDRLSPEKDVDGITSASLAKLLTGQGPGYAPCTAAACLRLLDYYQVPLHGSRAVVIGRSLVVGKPLSLLLTGRDATVTLCHSRTQKLPEICREAELLICAVGHAGLVDENYVNPSQTIIDVGINVGEDGKLCGDVDFASVEPLVAALSPVPGGLGGVTSAVLAEHVVRAAVEQNK